MRINISALKKTLTSGKIYNEYKTDEAKARENIRATLDKQWNNTYIYGFKPDSKPKNDVKATIRNYLTKELNLKIGIIKKLKINCKSELLSKLFK